MNFFNQTSKNYPMWNAMADEEYTNDFIFKICVIGDGAAGKTSLIKRFTQGSFNKDYIKTLGAQFSRFENKAQVFHLGALKWPVSSYQGGLLTVHRYQYIQWKGDELV